MIACTRTPMCIDTRYSYIAIYSKGGVLPQACSLSHSMPFSSYSARVTAACLASAVLLHSAIPFQASRRGSPPSRDDTILSGARKGKSGVSELRKRGSKLSIEADPPVTKMHLESLAP